MIRRALTISFGMIAALLIGAATAWACTASPTMTLEPASPAFAGGTGSTPPASPGAFVASAPNSTVTVKMVTGPWDTNTAVQIHWNSLTGPVLATTTGANFSVPVQVPQVAPGVYYVVAADAAGASKMAQAIEITGPVGAPAPAPAPVLQPANHSSSNLVLGAGLLGGGMVALFSGVTVVTLKRRRSTARR